MAAQNEEGENFPLPDEVDPDAEEHDEDNIQEGETAEAHQARVERNRARRRQERLDRLQEIERQQQEQERIQQEQRLLEQQEQERVRQEQLRQQRQNAANAEAARRGPGIPPPPPPPRDGPAVRPRHPAQAQNVPPPAQNVGRQNAAQNVAGGDAPLRFNDLLGDLQGAAAAQGNVPADRDVGEAHPPPPFGAALGPAGGAQIVRDHGLGDYLLALTTATVELSRDDIDANRKREIQEQFRRMDINSIQTLLRRTTVSNNILSTEANYGFGSVAGREDLVTEPRLGEFPLSGKQIKEFLSSLGINGTNKNAVRKMPWRIFLLETKRFLEHHAVSESSAFSLIRACTTGVQLEMTNYAQNSGHTFKHLWLLLQSMVNSDANATEAAAELEYLKQQPPVNLSKYLSDMIALHGRVYASLPREERNTIVTAQSRADIFIICRKYYPSVVVSLIQADANLKRAHEEEKKQLIILGRDPSEARTIYDPLSTLYIKMCELAGHLTAVGAKAPTAGIAHVSAVDAQPDGNQNKQSRRQKQSVLQNPYRWGSEQPAYFSSQEAKVVKAPKASGHNTGPSQPKQQQPQPQPQQMAPRQNFHAQQPQQAQQQGAPYAGQGQRQPLVCRSCNRPNHTWKRCYKYNHKQPTRTVACPQPYCGGFHDGECKAKPPMHLQQAPAQPQQYNQYANQQAQQAPAQQYNQFAPNQSTFNPPPQVQQSGGHAGGQN